MTTELTDQERFERAADHFASLRQQAPQGAISPKLVVPEGQPREYAEPEPDTCPDCGGTGWAVTDDDGAGAAERCACKVMSFDSPEQVPAVALELHGVPRDVSREVKATWKPKLGKWHKAFDEWPAGYTDDSGARPKWLLLTGVVGNGKSRAAAWVMRRAMAHGRRCWWVDVPVAVAMFKNAIGNDDATRTANTMLSAWMSRHTVVLDDIGATRLDSEYQEEIVSNMIRERYAGGGYTVATSNLSPEQLRTHHPRSASRMLSGVWVEMDGDDGRRRKWTLR